MNIWPTLRRTLAATALAAATVGGTVALTAQPASAKPSTECLRAYSSAAYFGNQYRHSVSVNGLDHDLTLYYLYWWQEATNLTFTFC